MGGAAEPGDGPTNGRGLLQMGLGGGDMLTGSAFSLNRETRQGGILSFWSRGAQSHFSGREGARRWCTDPAPSVSHDRPPGHRGDSRCMIST